MGVVLMSNRWSRKLSGSIPLWIRTQFIRFAATLTSNHLSNMPVELRNKTLNVSSVALYRIVFILFAAVIVAQAWSPRALTAQSSVPARNQKSQSDDIRFRDNANRSTDQRDAVSIPTNQNSKRTSVAKGGQPRQIADPNADVDSDDVKLPRTVRPNRVARAELRQPQQPDVEPGPLPEVPPFKLDQLVDAEQLVSPQGLKSSLGVGLVVSVLSLAPAILMMSTCFVRFIVVLSLLRQALGTPNLPPNQVLMGLSLCLTFLVMGPVWNESYQQGVRPYVEATSQGTHPNLPEVFEKTVAPIRRFMSHQIERSNNADAVWMFVEYQRPAKDSPEAESWHEPETYDEVSLTVLLPAYLLSELKTAFLIGFQIYLPFLIIDLVVASVLMSMGLPMLSPAQVSLPFKLLLFVLIDGWALTVGMLIESVRVA
ncbi:MAG: flagellar biosynthetic protein FliP [Planctomycetaceae bacterium]|nr:flagellar biosynthetic protein FliP [Planctomycetaceae bacterium]